MISFKLRLLLEKKSLDNSDISLLKCDSDFVSNSWLGMEWEKEGMGHHFVADTAEHLVVGFLKIWQYIYENLVFKEKKFIRLLQALGNLKDHFK